MRAFPVVGLALLTGSTSLLAQAPAAIRDSAVHALNRLAYGPTPAQVDDIARHGVMRWIDHQLEDHHGQDDAADVRRNAFPILAMSRASLAEYYAEMRRQKQMEQHEAAAMDAGLPRAIPARPPKAAPRELAGGLEQWVVVRATLANRQLAEVMADFWFNHFNVFMDKGADRFLLPSYLEETIRPRALGKFEDLLLATARSPAMLFYLDNAMSIAPGAEPTGRRLPGKPKASGLNENYARELLELHTLGVDGGYTQHDVIEVARILTGLSIDHPERGAGFTFHDWAHDRGPKQVLGQLFSAGHGEDEGERLLRMLANHPATMHHVSAKLCARFVSDEPSDECVDQAVAAWRRSHGEIREVLRAIFRSDAFWAAAAVRSKVKTPLEFVVSAIRATGGVPDSTSQLAQAVARLGEPLLRQASPAGYPETQEEWVNSGALLQRMNFAVALAAGRLPGVQVNLDSIAPATTEYDRLLDIVGERLLSGRMTEQTRRVIRRELAGVRDPVQARALAVGLALGGPEFQRQ